MSNSISSSSSSDIDLLEQLSDWDSDEDNMLDKTRSYEERINYLHKYDDYEFMYRFRFLKVTSKRFYALGTMLIAVADYIGVSKSSAGPIVNDVSEAIARLYPKLITESDHIMFVYASPTYTTVGDPGLENILLIGTLCFYSAEELILNEHVRVIPTPGHTLSDITVLVTSTDGVYAIAGDLFEKFEDIKDSKIWLEAGSENPKKQMKNRSMIADLAHWIVPGHGPKFKVTNEIRETLKTQLIEADNDVN